MKREKTAKVTISLPENLLTVADAMAKEQAVSRSEVIADLLKGAERERIEKDMEEGYREWNDTNVKLAEEAWPETVEMLRGIPWDEPHSSKKGRNLLGRAGTRPGARASRSAARTHHPE